MEGEGYRLKSGAKRSSLICTGVIKGRGLCHWGGEGLLLKEGEGFTP